jgi:hypothetical protein
MDIFNKFTVQTPPRKELFDSFDKKIVELSNKVTMTPTSVIGNLSDLRSKFNIKIRAKFG